MSPPGLLAPMVTSMRAGDLTGPSSGQACHHAAIPAPRACTVSCGTPGLADVPPLSGPVWPPVETLPTPATRVRSVTRPAGSRPGHFGPVLIHTRRPRPGGPGSTGVDLYRGTERQVVAAVLTHLGKMCLLRRSDAVSSDSGMWHCVTGYLPSGTQPLEQALIEITEETGLNRSDVNVRQRGQTQLLPDHRGGPPWRVFPFAFETSSTRIRLNWEHDRYCWIRLPLPAHRPSVPWLPCVLAALDGSSVPLGHPAATR